jgi:hypothetical protein
MTTTVRPHTSAAERARTFVDEVLIPREVEASGAAAGCRGGDRGDPARGPRARGWPAAATRSSTAARAGRRRSGWGRGAARALDQRLSWHIPSAYNVLASGTPAQIERYLKPALRGELHDA